jgi:hypothetical protein
MATRRKRTARVRRVRVLRSPIEPGVITLSPKTMLSLIPILLLCLGLAGNWYLTRDHLARVEATAAKLEADVESMKLERAAAQDDHALLLSIRDAIDKLKRKAGVE